MNILALDVSTNTGYAIFLGHLGLMNYGVLCVKNEDINYRQFSQKSMKAMVVMGQQLAKEVLALVMQYDIDTVVIEQTNKGKSRWIQKVLEWLHQAIVITMYDNGVALDYIDTSEWRSILNVRMTKVDKKHNRLVKLKRAKGKITPKHLAIRKVKELFNLDLKLKDNDIADAILVGYAHILKGSHGKSTNK